MVRKPIGVILAGGQSKRLFPFTLPKPLLKVRGRFLLDEALGRMRNFDVRVLSSRQIGNEISRAFKRAGLKVPFFWFEPEGRDTAAAVGFAVRMAKRAKAPWLAVLSADHWIPDKRGYLAFLRRVAAEIKKHPDSLFVAGSPSGSKDPSTHSQFGWIVPKKESRVSMSYPVARFVEKPSGSTLRSLRRLGGLVNAGMFFGRTEIFEMAFKKHFPAAIDSRIPYSRIPRQPVDRAIFEKFSKVRVLPFSLRWEDLGTWYDWHRLSSIVQEKRSSPQVRVGPKSKDIFVLSSSLKEISIFGLNDIAVVEDGGRLLVMPLSETNQLKKYLKS